VDFWNQHDKMLKAAWAEWWQNHRSSPELPNLVETKEQLINPDLQQAVRTLRQEPTQENEAELQDLFQTIIPNQVYQIPVFTPEGIRRIRQHIDAASYHYNHLKADNNKNKEEQDQDDNDNIAAGIPTRRPNGMNRYGIILDRSVEGGVSYDGINDFMEQFTEEYIRPLGRSFFSELTSRNSPEDDAETYAFTIRYQPDEDMELKEHSDAAIYTLNINLNIAEGDSDDDPHHQRNETYEGSTLYFLDENTKERVPVLFQPGMAYLHKGLVRHAALPITSGERHNLVIWVFGKGGYVRFGEYPEEERLTVQERWGKGGSSNGQNKKKRIEF
jgi:hypothetical protein